MVELLAILLSSQTTKRDREALAGGPSSESADAHPLVECQEISPSANFICQVLIESSRRLLEQSRHAIIKAKEYPCLSRIPPGNAGLVATNLLGMSGIDW